MHSLSESCAQLFGACKSLPNGCLQCMPEFSPAANQLARLLPDEAGCKRLSKWLERTQKLSVLIFKSRNDAVLIRNL